MCTWEMSMGQKLGFGLLALAGTWTLCASYWH